MNQETTSWDQICQLSTKQSRKLNKNKGFEDASYLNLPKTNERNIIVYNRFWQEIGTITIEEAYKL